MFIKKAVQSNISLLHTKIYIILMHLLYINRLLKWSDAQNLCESENMTLFQYDNPDKYDNTADPIDYLMKSFFERATELGDVVFLGLQRNLQVFKLG